MASKRAESAAWMAARRSSCSDERAGVEGEARKAARQTRANGTGERRMEGFLSFAVAARRGAAGRRWRDPGDSGTGKGVSGTLIAEGQSCPSSPSEESTMKKSTCKLRLHRETLSQMGEVTGGASTVPSVCVNVLCNLTTPLTNCWDCR